MKTVRRKTITLTGATGGSGSATATTTTDYTIEGVIRAVYVEYTDSPPATTDVTIEGATTPAVPILTLTNANTSGWFHPMHQADNTAGSAITNQGMPIAIEDRVSVTIAQANNDDGVTVTIVYEGI